MATNYKHCQAISGAHTPACGVPAALRAGDPQKQGRPTGETTLPSARSNLPPVSANTVLLEPGHTSSFMYPLQQTDEELQQRAPGLRSLAQLLSGSLRKSMLTPPKVTVIHAALLHVWLQLDQHVPTVKRTKTIPDGLALQFHSASLSLRRCPRHSKAYSSLLKHPENYIYFTTNRSLDKYKQLFYGRHIQMNWKYCSEWKRRGPPPSCSFLSDRVKGRHSFTVPGPR